MMQLLTILGTFKDISNKSDWVLQPCTSTARACDDTGKQNRTRTCSIEPDNNEESLNEVASDACTLPVCHFKADNVYQIQGQQLIGEIPARSDVSKSIFRDCI